MINIGGGGGGGADKKNLKLMSLQVKQKMYGIYPKK